MREINKEKLLSILKDVSHSKITPEKAFELIRYLPYEDLGIAKIDHQRILISGIPEVILAKDKTPDEVIKIAKGIYKVHKRFIITKASEGIYRRLRIRTAKFYKRSGCIIAGDMEKSSQTKGCILILTAGTSDAGVAEEVKVTAEFLGDYVEVISDVGIAGLHRILDHKDRLKSAKVIIVIAGMEGALPSIVAALTDKPVIGVPTSSGYGMSLGGFASLVGMLNSCVPGVAVVNIDNGFGAACLAHRIIRVTL